MTRKIAFLIQSFHIGGTETCIYNICNKIKNSFEFHFIATGNPDIHPKFKALGKTKYMGENWAKLTNYLKENNIDIVQYGNLPDYKNCAINARVPSIIERVAGPRSLKSDHKGVTHLISSSHGIVPQIKSTYSGPITVIHNGVDTKQTINPIRHFNKDDFVVIYPCSRLGRGQRVSDIIAAIAKARLHNDKIRLIITGDRPNQKGYENIKPELTKQARAIKGSCVFTGFIDNMDETILGSNLCVVPAASHGISNGLIQAANLGKPLISSKVGQADEICHHGKNGYLVRTGDIDQMSKYIVYLSRSKGVYNEFSRYGKELVNKEFNINTQAKKYLDLYNKLSK